MRRFTVQLAPRPGDIPGSMVSAVLAMQRFSKACERMGTSFIHIHKSGKICPAIGCAWGARIRD